MVKHIFDCFFSFSEPPEIRTVEGFSAAFAFVRCEHRLCSQTKRATICATPRYSFFIIMITHTVVKYQFSFLQRNMRNLSILVFGRNVSFCYFHLDSIPESHYNKTTAVSPVLQTLLTTSLETVHCCQSPFFFLSMLRKYKNAATFVAAFLWWTIQDSNL